jgi:hypothetical protein
MFVGVALAVMAGAVPAHAMAPLLLAIGAAWSTYQQVDGTLASVERGAFQACLAWAETTGEQRAMARLKPMAAHDPAMVSQLAALDAAMGQTADTVVPKACTEIPQGGVIETFASAINFLDTAPSPTPAAHIAQIKALTAAKRAAIGAPPLPEPALLLATREPRSPGPVYVPTNYQPVR